MSEQPKHTPGPWHASRKFVYVNDMNNRVVAEVIDRAGRKANARLIAASPLLLEAAQLLEAVELGRQDCDECEGEGEPEACGTCFPLFDDARVKRRAAIAKATENSP